MRTFFKKYGYWIIGTVILAAVALYGFTQTEEPVPAEKHHEVRFCVELGEEKQALNLYQAEDGSCHVFLPSGVSLEQVKVAEISGTDVYLDGIQLEAGMDCGSFALETEYAFLVNDRRETLRFWQSANTAALYVYTVSGSAESIHGQKGYEETAAAALYTADGELCYADSRCTINTRGNTTWDYAKKPYALKLSQAGDLLGMGAAKNWILLANASDETNLRSKLILDLANQIDPQLAPECEYVDLYLNGEYRGLYLLTEKVETGENRLNLNTEAGEFLCKIDLDSRQGTLRNPFQTNLGRTIEVCAPENLKHSQWLEIQTLVGQMEQAITEAGDITDWIDVDSWARKYLIDEISGNVDADLTSSYFYYRDGKFYGGPVWDYDMTLGSSFRNEDPRTFIAKNRFKSPSYYSPYYAALYENEVFYSRMTELYEQEFLPLLEQLRDTGIDQLARQIETASEMNRFRWQDMYQEKYDEGILLRFDTEDLIKYLRRRMRFLNSAWLDGEEYCVVQFDIREGDAYKNFSVPYGSRLETDYVDLENTLWYNASTGETVDFSQGITQDMILIREYPDPSLVEPENTRSVSQLLEILSGGLVVLMLVCLIFMDRRNSGFRK